MVVVDNTSSDVVASLYPHFLSRGLSVVTPNKKAYSSSLELYKQIFTASTESGTKVLYESTVGAGLPIVSTLKDLIQTGDKVRYQFFPHILFIRMMKHQQNKKKTGNKNRRCPLRYTLLPLQ